MRALIDIRLLCSAVCMLALSACAANGGPRQNWEPSPPRIYQAPEPTAGAIFQAGTDMALYGDVKARNVGDILTVLLSERTSASKSASTSTSKESGIDFGVPTIFGRTIPEGAVSLDHERDFSGSGNSTQSNQLDGQVTVTVADRLPNGTLVVRGEKRLMLNQGEEFIRIEGLVRPADITPQNTVVSTQIADARIIYSGKGSLADANAQGWLSRFFNSALWPF